MKDSYLKRPNRNLIERIREAESDEEITALLADGASFDEADDRTRSRWHKAAKLRRREISE